jgi:hypothetical protein
MPIVSQGLETSASLGNFFPSPHSQLQDATNLWGLNLPPNAMRVLAQCQTLGRLPPALLNRPVQPPSVAGSSFATARTRSISRSHSQPNAPKSRSSSTYARGVPIPKPLPQPSKAVHYKSPPLKARAHRTKSKVKATMVPVASGSTSASESQPDPSHLAMARAITEQPGLGEIPIDLLVQILPSLIETIESNKAGRRSNSSVEGDVRTSETGILSDSMADSESASPSDIGVPAMEVPPVQLPVSSTPIVQPEQSPLIAQFQSVPATSNNDTDSSMGISAAIPTIQFPDWYPTINLPEGQSAVLQCLLDLEHSLATEAAPSDVGPALPTCARLEGPLSAVPNSQGSSIESGSGAGETRTDSDSIDRFIDEILDGSLEGFVGFECLERV